MSTCDAASHNGEDECEGEGGDLVPGLFAGRTSIPRVHPDVRQELPVLHRSVLRNPGREQAVQTETKREVYKAQCLN